MREPGSPQNRIRNATRNQGPQGRAPRHRAGQNPASKNPAGHKPAGKTSASQNRAAALEAALREQGVRVTRQRAALLRLIAACDDHPDAAELHQRACAADAGVSLATVYRTLSALEASGLVERVQFQGGPARIEPRAGAHHDHMIDVDTGAVIEFHDPRIELLQDQIAAERGYEILSHRLELHVRRRRRR